MKKCDKNPSPTGPAKREIRAKSVLTPTAIPSYDFCINPYVGCAHGCTYCYASFMKRFTGHGEPWGSFVDIKVNAPEVLARQLARPRVGSVLFGTVTDPYQPAEREYGITRDCLGLLGASSLRVHLLTRSPLCLRDIDLFKEIESLEIGLSIGTDKDEIRRIFEPAAPPIGARVEALKKLRREGVRTYAFIGPMLPLDPEAMAALLAGAVDEVLVDRLNYPRKVVGLYRRHGMEPFLEDGFFVEAALRMEEAFAREGVPVSLLFDCSGGSTGGFRELPDTAGGRS